MILHNYKVVISQIKKYIRIMQNSVVCIHLINIHDNFLKEKVKLRELIFFEYLVNVFDCTFVCQPL